MQPKLIAAIAMVLAGTLCGRTLAGTAQRRYRSILELLDALKLLRLQIVELSEPLDRALVQTGFPVFHAVSEKLSGDVGVPEAWRMVCEKEWSRGGRLDGLTSGDRTPLDQLFGRLGQSGRSGQEQILEVCRTAMECARDEARERSAQAARLYPAIGLLTGLAAAVILV